MGDDVSQVISLEFETWKIVLKASMKMASYIARAFYAIVKWCENYKETHKGEHSYPDLVKMSKGGNPQVVQVDEDILKDVLKDAKAKGLHYAYLPDLISNDKKTPVAVPAQDFPLFLALVETHMSNKNKEDKETIEKINGEINEINEKKLTAKDDDKALLEVKGENLEQRKQELQTVIDNRAKNLEDAKKGIGTSLEEYLASAKGTVFEMDPEKAIAELEHGVPNTISLKASECFQPVRDPSLVPEEGLRFYLPENGIVVTRNFVTEEIGNDIVVVYSNYTFKNNSGEIFEYSDKGMTRDTWNEEIVPKMLDNIGISEDTMCKAFDHEKELNAYIKYHNNVELDSEKKFMKNEKTVFSSAEAESSIIYAITDKAKGIASAQTINEDIVFEVPTENIFIENGKVNFTMDGKTYSFEHNQPVQLGPKDKDAKTSVISTKKDSLIVMDKGKDNSKTFSAEAFKDVINNAAEAVMNLTKGR